MKISLTPSLAAALLLTATFVSAEKDGSYYANGVTNPNVEEKMYWKEPYNVLEDLDQFDALYVTYHNCAWETPTGDDDNNNGGGGGEDDSWYLGSVPSFRPNVAYSLYGVLKGEQDSGCNKKTFINSFHTTQGVESFTNAMYAAGTELFAYVDGDENDNEENGGGNNGDPTSTCYQVDNDGEDNQDEEEDADADEDADEDDADGDEDEEQGEEENGDNDEERKRRRRRRRLDDNNYYNGAKYDQSAVSYGLGCTDRSQSSNNKAPQFAIHTYLGDYCDANAILVTRDDLEDFNERLEQSTCVRIYTDGDAAYDNEEDGNNNDEDGDSPLTLLASSRSCQIYDGTGTCPDPHGKLKYYELNLSKATGIQGMHSWWTVQRVFVAGWSMLSVGILTAIIGIGLFVKECIYPSTGGVNKSAAGVSKMTRSRSKGEGSLASAISKSLSVGNNSKSSKSTKSTKSRRKSKRNSSNKSASSSAASASQDSIEKSARGDVNKSSEQSVSSKMSGTQQGDPSDDEEQMQNVHDGFEEDKSREDLSSHDGDTTNSATQQQQQQQDKSATDNEDNNDEEAFADEQNITSDDEGHQSDASGLPNRPRRWFSKMMSGRRRKSSKP